MHKTSYNMRYAKKKRSRSKTFLKISECVYGPRTLFINI